MLINDLQRMIRKGNVITSTGSRRSRYHRTGHFLGTRLNLTATQKQDVSFSFDQSRTALRLQALLGGPPKSDVPLVAIDIRPPSAAGSSTALPIDGVSDPKSGVTPASIKFDTRADLDPGIMEWRDASPPQSPIAGVDPRPYVAASSKSPIGFDETSEGSFRVLKRLDGPETLAVQITRKKEMTALMALGEIIVQMQDPNT